MTGCKFELGGCLGFGEEKLDDAGAESCIRARLTDVERGVIAQEGEDVLRDKPGICFFVGWPFTKSPEI